MSTSLLLLPLLVLFFFSAFFALSETAIFASNKYRIKHLATEGNRRAQKLVSWLESPEKLLATLVLGNTFANIGAATVSATIVARLAPARYLSVALAGQAVALTFIILLFCEFGPKALAARHADRISLSVVVPVQICTTLLYPITRQGVRIVGFLFPSVKAGTAADTPTVTDAELRALISNSHEDRSKMLERVMEFSERQVKDVMVPRMEVTALEITTPLEGILDVVESTRYSRFPVYQGVLDNIVGILHGKDLMPYLHHPKTFRLQQLLRKPVFIPDTGKLDHSVRMLQNAQTHLGIVVDEHGGMEGIATLEDLIEQIVGEIQDEHDVEVDSVVTYPDGTFLIDAGISIHELNERLNLNIPETNQYVTLAGFLLAKAGRLLKEGEEVEFESNLFRVEQKVGRRIMRARLTQVSPPAPKIPNNVNASVQ